MTRKRLAELEEEFIRFNMENRPINHSELGLKQWGERVAHHFAEWQYQKDRAEFAKLKAKEWSDGYDEGIAKGKEQIMDEWLKDRDGCFWDGVEEGKKAMEEQMLNEAVAEVEVGMRGDPIEIILDKYVQRAMGIFPGDKVRIIICKKEDEK